MSAWLLGVDCVHSECVFWLSLFLIHKYPECVFRAAAVLDFYLLIGFGAELFLFLTAEDHTCFLSASNIGSLWSKTVKAIEPGKGRIPATRSGHTAWWSHPPWSDAPAVAWSLPLSPRPPWNHNTRGKQRRTWKIILVLQKLKQTHFCAFLLKLNNFIWWKWSWSIISRHAD